MAPNAVREAFPTLPISGNSALGRSLPVIQGAEPRRLPDAMAVVRGFARSSVKNLRRTQADQKALPTITSPSYHGCWLTMASDEMNVQITPNPAFVDRDVHIRVTGAPPGELVRVTAWTLDDSSRRWESHADFTVRTAP